MPGAFLHQPRSLGDLVKSFLRLEAEENLFSVEVRGHPIWEYVRYPIFEQVVAANLDVQTSGPLRRRAYLGTVAALVEELWRGLRAAVRTVPAYDILLVNNTVGRYVEGTRADFYMQPVAVALTPHYKILVFSHYDDRVNPRDYPCDVFIGASAHAVNSLKSRLVRIGPAGDAQFSRIGQLILEAFRVEGDVAGFAKRIFTIQVANHAYFSRLLSVLRPRLMLYCDNGAAKGMIKAAHELGVAAVECQHGVVSAYNVLYQYHENVCALDVATTTADYIFTFGDFWNDQYSIPGKTMSVGFPYLELVANGFILKGRLEKSKSIIVVSVLSSAEDLARIAIDLAGLLPDYTVYYKLRHDEYADWPARYPSRFRTTPNLVIVEDDQRPLHDYFRECRYQVGANSMAVYEGLALGVTTFILRSGRYEEMRPLIEGDYVFLVSGSKEIIARIHDGAAPPRQVDAADLFKRGSLKHVEAAVDEIMKAERPPS